MLGTRILSETAQWGCQTITTHPTRKCKLPYERHPEKIHKHFLSQAWPTLKRHDQLCFIRSGLEKGIRIPNTADTFSSNQKHLHKVTVWNATKAIFCNAKLQQINLFLCWQNLMIYLKIFGKTKKIHSWIQVQSVLEGRSCVLLSILSLSKKKARARVMDA